MVSEDSVRRALAAMAPEASEPWMRSALMASVRDALERPWVLDMDATIKPLYGHQEGAEIGYNPHKPGRPSHVLHTIWVGNLRLVRARSSSAARARTMPCWRVTRHAGKRFLAEQGITRIAMPLVDAAKLIGRATHRGCNPTCA